MRSRRPVLFLDFDGVVSWCPRDPEEVAKVLAVDRLYPEALARLDRICELARPRLVVSSSWRVMPAHDPPLEPVAALNGWLRAGGARVAVVEDVTPVHEACVWDTDVARVRGGEIAAWLADNAARGTPWCALDDLPLAGCPYLVRVRGGELADEDVDRAVDLLRPLTAGEVVLLRALEGVTLLRHLRRDPDAAALLSLLPGLERRGLVRPYGRGRSRSFALTPAGDAAIL